MLLILDPQVANTHVSTDSRPRAFDMLRIKLTAQASC